MDAKSIFASKTFWVNAFVLILGALQAFKVVNVTDSATVADTLAGFVMGGIGAANIVLRLVTKQPVSLSGK